MRPETQVLVNSGRAKVVEAEIKMQFVCVGKTTIECDMHVHADDSLAVRDFIEAINSVVKMLEDKHRRLSDFLSFVPNKDISIDDFSINEIICK